MKQLKQTSFGRKIYENLMMNYGEYFQINNNLNHNNHNNYKVQDGRRKSNMEKGMNLLNNEK
jgi:hypothetical protein